MKFEVEIFLVSDNREIELETSYDTFISIWRPTLFVRRTLLTG